MIRSNIMLLMLRSKNILFLPYYRFIDGLSKLKELAVFMLLSTLQEQTILDLKRCTAPQLYTGIFSLSRYVLFYQCLQPCSIHVTYSSISPMPELKDSIPPKVDISVSLTKIDIKLSTNLIYHALDAMAILKGLFALSLCFSLTAYI